MASDADSSSVSSDADSLFEYDVGEKAFCLFKDDAFECVILDKSRLDSDHWMYKVHYQGWNSAWDEDVRANRLLPKIQLTSQVYNELRKVRTQLNQIAGTLRKEGFKIDDESPMRQKGAKYVNHLKTTKSPQKGQKRKSDDIVSPPQRQPKKARALDFSPVRTSVTGGKISLRGLLESHSSDDEQSDGSGPLSDSDH